MNCGPVLAPEKIQRTASREAAYEPNRKREDDMVSLVKHSRGNFADPRLGIDIKQSPDMVGPKSSQRSAPISIACRHLHHRPQASMLLSRNVGALSLTRHA